MTDLYDADYWAWTQKQAEALRRRSGNELDWDLLAQELDALGATEERELRSRYIVLIAHLLKWAYQPDRRSRSWTNTIANQRADIANHLQRNPDLKSMEEASFLGAYSNARREASSETDLDLDVFPTAPPFTKEQAKNEDWLPDAVARA
jgi:Domain of unknown function DUF29